MTLSLFRRRTDPPAREASPFPVPERHAVLGTRLQPPFPDGIETAIFGMGCFWGAERLFWALDGVFTTAAGYAGGTTGEASASSDPELLTVAAGEDEWRERLTRDEFRVLRKAGTERPFSGEYVKTSADGTYRCRACGSPLFDSAAKFDSRTGWPGFTGTITPEAVTLHTDRKLGMRRTEVRCGRCDSHLGHVFDDGPRDAEAGASA